MQFKGCVTKTNRAWILSTIWKIAPGNHAEDWDLFLKFGCIGIGWLDGQDFRCFKSVPETLAELRREYGKDVPGYGEGCGNDLLVYARGTGW